MSSQTGRNRKGWRSAAVGAVAGGALAVGLVLGAGAPLASAEPAAQPTPSTDPAAPPPMTPDQLIAYIDQEYDTGAGGGQLSNLIHKVMKLRSQGFMPSKANVNAILEALNHRPNQGPLVEALQATYAYQTNAKARAAVAGQQQQQPGMGAWPGQTMPPTGDSGIILPSQ
jgi:hypothetical protein